MGTCVEALRAAKSSQEALLVLAEALDRIEAQLAVSAQEPAPPADPWALDHTAWNGPVPIKVEEDLDAETTTVVLPPPSKAAQNRRRALAPLLGMEHAWGGSAEDWTEVFVKGGAVWLYTTDRALVMGLPPATRRALVQDALDTDPQFAHEMGRDVLKDEEPGELPNIFEGDTE